MYCLENQITQPGHILDMMRGIILTQTDLCQTVWVQRNARQTLRHRYKNIDRKHYFLPEQYVTEICYHIKDMIAVYKRFIACQEWHKSSCVQGYGVLFSDHRLLVSPIRVHGQIRPCWKYFSFKTLYMSKNEVVIIIFDICSLKYYFC